jgi:hypothetical protein
VNVNSRKPAIHQQFYLYEFPGKAQQQQWTLRHSPTAAQVHAVHASTVAKTQTLRYFVVVAKNALLSLPKYNRRRFTSN